MAGYNPTTTNHEDSPFSFYVECSVERFHKIDVIVLELLLVV